MPTVLRLLPELEDSLRQLPGVRAASVVTGADSVPTEVHLLASPGKSAKQFVRDVQSLALAQFDIDIDHRIVSVVQLGDDDVPETAAAVPRVVVASITVRTAGPEVEATVGITSGDVSFEGSARGPAGGAHRARLVAVATLDALRDLLGRSCGVESASILAMGARHVAVCVITVSVPRAGEQILTGSAAVRGDEADAVCRSVLNALNRTLSG